MKPSKSAGKLAEMIKKAINDHQITNSEYETILSLADEDGHLDAQEKRLMAELNEMISNKTVKRIP